MYVCGSKVGMCVCVYVGVKWGCVFVCMCE